MAKVKRIAKLELIGGKAKPGPELASIGIMMPQFCRQFNDATKGKEGEVIPVVITAFEDKSFKFELKTTPTAIMLKKAAKIEKGSANSKTTKVATIKMKDLEEIAKYKMKDLNTKSIESAKKIIHGTAKNMGIVIEGYSKNQGEDK